MKQKVFFKKKKNLKCSYVGLWLVNRTEFIYLAFVACWRGSVNYLTWNGVL